MLLQLVNRVLPRAVSVGARRHGSVSVRPLPPPSPVKNIPEYIEPNLCRYEHVPAAYREQRKPPKWTLRFAYFLGAIAWTWILLGIYYEPEHIYGHYPWPDANKWTDKELGIPDDLELDE